jgi:pectinesterase
MSVQINPGLYNEQEFKPRFRSSCYFWKMIFRQHISLIFLLIALDTVHASCAEQEHWDFIVAADGSGDFTTVQEAIDAVPHLRKNRTTIYIRNGVYREKLILPSTKTNVTFQGESTDGTIITWDDYASRKNIFGEEIGTSGSSGFYIYGEGFVARNITFSNTAGPVGQAVAVRVDGDRVLFEDCRFLGFQDTLYPHGEESRQYYRRCYIEGTVDFIFGWSTVVFEECTIFCKGKGYITAASTPESSPFGFVFLRCRVTGDAEKNSFYLGRPWRPYSNVVFLECELGPQIRPEGWHNWNKPEAEQTAYYAEYKCTGEGADTGDRVPWSYRLTDEEAARYTPLNILGDWITEFINP